MLCEKNNRILKYNSSLALHLDNKKRKHGITGIVFLLHKKRISKFILHFITVLFIQ